MAAWLVIALMQHHLARCKAKRGIMGQGISSKKIQIRALSAFLIAPVVLGIIWYGHVAFAALLGIALGLSLSELWQMSKHMQSRWAAFLSVGLYIAFGVFMCFHLRHIYGFYATYLFFFAMWGSDVGAYFSGKFIGGAKMSPGISPNKTWAGYWGALITPAIVLMLGLWSFDYMLIVAGIVLGVAGQAGDLFVSWLKRDARVKDTGNIIPGHGGLLDRIDSLIPAIFVFLALIKAGFLGSFEV